MSTLGNYWQVLSVGVKQRAIGIEPTWPAWKAELKKT